MKLSEITVEDLRADHDAFVQKMKQVREQYPSLLDPDSDIKVDANRLKERAYDPNWRIRLASRSPFDESPEQEFQSGGEIFLYEFATYVFKILGLEDWKVKVASKSACANDLKLIEISSCIVNNQPWYYIKELFLLEVAHIGETRQGSVDTHDGDFFRRLGALCILFADYKFRNTKRQDAVTR